MSGDSDDKGEGCKVTMKQIMLGNGDGELLAVVDGA